MLVKGSDNVLVKGSDKGWGQAADKGWVCSVGGIRASAWTPGPATVPLPASR